MPAGQRRPRDPRLDLVRLVDRLSRRQTFVTDTDLAQAAARPSSRLTADQLTALVDAAVRDSLLLKDLRTFYDRESSAYTQAWVYRVNARHPLAAEVLSGPDS